MVNILFLINVSIGFWLVGLAQRSFWLIDPYWTILPPVICLFYQLNPKAPPARTPGVSRWQTGQERYSPGGRIDQPDLDLGGPADLVVLSAGGVEVWTARGLAVHQNGQGIPQKLH